MGDQVVPLAQLSVSRQPGQSGRKDGRADSCWGLEELLRHRSLPMGHVDVIVSDTFPLGVPSPDGMITLVWKLGKSFP